MNILKQSLTREELKQIADNIFGNMVKAVVDVERGLVAVDADLHSDLESLLLENGSKQTHLWGVNLYPEALGEGLIEYDSMINMRPSQGNRSRGIESEPLRKKIVQIIQQWVKA